MKRLSAILAGGLLFVLASNAQAHEPLWGEAASTVGDRVWHPDLKLSLATHRLMNGDSTIPNPDARKRTIISQTTSIDYGIGPKLNLRLEVPLHRLDGSQLMGGASVSSKYTALGDIMLSVKRRHYLKVGRGTKSQQATMFGLRLPTGATNRRDSAGGLIGAERQPGAGTPGTMLGYMATWEGPKNTIWASLMWEQWFHRARFTPGDGIDLDASYGHWLKFPESIPDLGTMLTIGVHSHWHDFERGPTGRDPNSGNAQFALQSTFIAQKSQYQLRVGVLFPIAQGVNGVQLAERTQFRFGIEKFF